MPDISALNGTAIDNVAEFDGLTVTDGPAFVGLLDTYTGAAAGYSTRRLASATTVLLRVRRETAGGTGDDNEADVAYDSNNQLSLDSAISNASAGVTATTLGQFINVGTVGGTTYTNPDSLTGTASCLVTEWKDQSGNANDAEQTTQGSQPQIHDGTVNTDLITENGKPTVSFPNLESLNTGFDTSSTAFDLPQTMYLATRIVSPGSYQNFTFQIGGASAFSLGKFNMIASENDTTTTVQYRTGTTVQESVLSYTDTAMYLLGGYWQASTLKAAYNGAALTSGSSITEGDFSNNTLIIGGNSTTSDGDFNVGEFLIWPSDQDSAGNKSGIEGNVNAHFQIGNFGTPTSGLLATYTGAAAAYSVRQLANTAALSMRVREDATDTETDIGFDANGDLDTAAIAAHCGTANGYVVNWYDQSGEQNDATQSTLASQPQIYNGTAVITENGKPAVEFDGSDDGLATSNIIQSFTYASLFVAYKSTSIQQQNIVRYRPNGFVGTKNGWIYEQGPDKQYGGNTLIGAGVNAVGAIVSGEGGSPTLSQHLLAMLFEQSQVLAYENGTLDATLNTVKAGTTPVGTASVNDEFWLGRNNDSNDRELEGKMQEVIIYHSDQSSNRTGIETDINTYFSIY